MKVSEILAKKGSRVVTKHPGATIKEIVTTLSRESIGAVVISRDGKSVLGLIAERTIVQGLKNHGADLLGMTAEQLMEPHPAGCHPDDGVRHVMRQMTMYRRRHVPVVDGDRLVGILSIGDVVRSRLDDLVMETNVLRDVLAASH